MIDVFLPPTEALGRAFDEATARLLGRVRQQVEKESIDLQAHIKTDKLSGQVLGRRSGRLSRSINYQMKDTATGVEGTVGTNVSYARVHEFGLQGPVNVQGHLRTIKQVFGVPLAQPVAVQVAPHTRNVNYPERSFLRSAFEDRREGIEQRIGQAIAEGIAGGAR